MSKLAFGRAALLILVLLASAAPAAAQEPGEPEGDSSTSEVADSAPAESPAEPGESGDPTEPSEPEEGAEPAEGGEADEGGESGGPQLPRRLPERRPLEEQPEVEVAFRSDAECLLRIDGEELGRLLPGEVATFPVRAGQHLLRAVSSRFPEADFRRTVRVREEGEQQFEIRLQRQIEDLHRRQRRELIYRDPDRRPTPLMWNRRDNGADVRWSQAESYCAGLKLGGYEDWRLPSLDELESIQARWSVAPIKVMGAFLLSACCPWSSERQDDDRAWNFNFRYRKPFLGNVAYSLDLRALCVREWDPEAEEDRTEDKRENDDARPEAETKKSQ